MGRRARGREAAACAAQETERLTKEAPPGISAKPHEDNLRYFQVVITGPHQSPY